MKITLDGLTMKIASEPGDKPFSNESGLLHNIKLELNKRGFDLIKKLMWKDGHMVSDTQHYLRTRSKRSAGPHIFLSDGNYAIRDMAKAYRLDGSIELDVTYDVFEAQNSQQNWESLLPRK